MGYAQFRASDLPTQPPEPPTEVTTAAGEIYVRAYDRELKASIDLIDRMLLTGKGVLRSVDSHGRVLDFDTGDLWDALTENPESADLAVLAAFVRAPDHTLLAQRARKLIEKNIREFAEVHAERIAAQEERDYLLDRGY